MNDFAWIAPLKEAVLALFFLVFCGILYYTAQLRDVEEMSNIPFVDEETA